MELGEDGITKLRTEAEAGDADAIWVLKHQLKIPSQYLPAAKPRRRFAGFDDEDVSSSEDDAGVEEEESLTTSRVKVAAD